MAKVVKIYDYVDEHGTLLFQVLRYDPKDFRQRRPNGNGGWTYSLNGVRRVLYNLPGILSSDGMSSDGIVWLVEGEKDADALIALGLVATTAPMGAGKWREEFTEMLRGRHVIILPDADERGRNHARQVAQALQGVAKTVYIVELPDLPPKGDVSDWLAVPGNDSNKLIRLCEVEMEKQAARTEWPEDRRGDAWEPHADRSTKTSSNGKPIDGDWPPTIPLIAIPASAVFPISVFPRPLQQYIQEGAKALNCPPDYFAVPMLAIAGGSIGNSRWLAITRTHDQSAALFACVVGSKGTAKSPALKLVREPLDQAQRDRRHNWERETVAWEETEAAKKEHERKPAPVMERVIVGDITTESLSMLLDENQRGLTQVRDELAGLLASMNQYKSGGGHDRQWYLEVWGHNLSPRDRKADKGPPVFLDRPFVGIVGGTQPDVVERFRGESRRGAPPPDDGFVDRWLFSYPAELPAIGETWLEISPETKEAWADCVRRLLALKQEKGDNGEQRPFFLRLSPSGREAWQAFTNQHAAEMNAADFPEELRGYWSKLRGYCGRLALIVHLLHADDDKAEVDAGAVKCAAELVDYFKSHARKVFAMMGADSRIAAAKKILAWIVREERVEFKRWEVHKDLQSKGMFPSPDSLDRPLELLERHNYIRKRPEESERRAGRPPSPTYLVNPLFDRQESSGESGKP